MNSSKLPQFRQARQRAALADQFVPSYKSLLACPGFVTHIDGTRVGALYRQLKKLVWREVDTSLGGMLLSQQVLTASIRDRALAQNLGVSTRQVRTLRRKLVDYGLVHMVIKPGYNSDLHVYVLGRVGTEFQGQPELTADEAILASLKAGHLTELNAHFASPTEAPGERVYVSRDSSAALCAERAMAHLTRLPRRQVGSQVPDVWNSTSNLTQLFHAVQHDENGPKNPPKEKDIKEKEKEGRAASTAGAAVRGQEVPMPGLFGEEEVSVSHSAHQATLTALLAAGEVRRTLDYLHTNRPPASTYLPEVKPRAAGVSYGHLYPLAAWVARQEQLHPGALKAPEWLYQWWRAYAVDAQHVALPNPAQVRGVMRRVVALCGDRAGLALAVLDRAYTQNRRLTLAQPSWLYSEVTRVLNADPGFLDRESARTAQVSVMRENVQRRVSQPVADPLRVALGLENPDAPLDFDAAEPFDLDDLLDLGGKRVD
jgi:hypothetical protein